MILPIFESAFSIFGIKRYFKTAEHPYFKNYLKYKINPVLNKFWQESIS